MCPNKFNKVTKLFFAILELSDHLEAKNKKGMEISILTPSMNGGGRCAYDIITSYVTM